MKRALITGLLLWMLQPASAQEMFGSAFSNYAGQMGVGFNPATIVGAPYRWELHILSGDFAAQNNYMYLKANSKLIRKSVSGDQMDDDRVTDNYTQSDKWMYSSSFLKYPGFIWVGEKFSFGASISTRAEMSANEIAPHLAKFMKEGFDYDPLQQQVWSTDRGKAAFLNWHEFALTGGTVLWDDGVNYWTGAITLNYNFGLNGLYLDMHEMEYNSVADTLLEVYDLSADYGYALPQNTDPDLGDYLSKRGNGFSGSMGVRYMYNRNDAWFDPCRRKTDDKPYDFRLGIGLIDIGSLKFKTGTNTYSIANASTQWYGIDTVKFENIQQMDSMLGVQFGGSEDAFLTGHSLSIATPAAFTFDIDVPFNSWFFINAAAIQRIPVAKYQVLRMNQLAITPRVEFRRFEFAMPLSIYNYKEARLGAALRFGILTVGTDIISPLIGLTDAYGVDFYFGISLKGVGECGRKNSTGGRKARIEKCNTP